jgi:hypothetical protein
MVVVGFLPKEFLDRANMPADIFTSRTPDDITNAMRGAGFREARIVQKDAATKWKVAVAVK